MVTLPGSGTGGDPMEPKPLERKLAAILYADVAGYARLTGEDEDATHRACTNNAVLRDRWDNTSV